MAAKSASPGGAAGFGRFHLTRAQRLDTDEKLSDALSDPACHDRQRFDGSQAGSLTPSDLRVSHSHFEFRPAREQRLQGALSLLDRVLDQPEPGWARAVGPITRQLAEA
jgi:hypothetical protein